MAPELLLTSTNSCAHDTKLDIWSLGICIFMLLSGTHPFDNRSKQEILANFKSSEPNQHLYSALMSNSEPDFSKMPNDVTDLAVSFIKRCLTIDPEQRPSASQLLEDIWCKEHIASASVDFYKVVKILNNMAFFERTDAGTFAICSYITNSTMTSQEEI